MLFWFFFQALHNAFRQIQNAGGDVAARNASHLRKGSVNATPMAVTAAKSFPLCPALVLGGGGARAAYQVGVLRALGEILPHKKLPFGILCGTSAGSINAAYLAARAEDWSQATEQLARIWMNLELKDIYDTSGLSLSRIASAWVTRTAFGGWLSSRQASNHLLDTKPLEKLLLQEVDFSKISTHIRNQVVQGVCFSAVQYFAQTTVSFFDAADEVQDWEHSGRKGIRGQLEARHVMASSAIPVFFPPVQINDAYFGDGSLRQTCPLSPAIHLGAERIVSVSIRTQKKKTKKVSELVKRQPPALAEIIGEIFNSLFLDSLDADIERLQRVNEAVRHYAQRPLSPIAPPLREIPILSLAPSRNLGEFAPNLMKEFPIIIRYLFNGLGVSDKDEQGKELISYLAFIKEQIKPLADLGYEDTLRRRQELQEFMA